MIFVALPIIFCAVMFFYQRPRVLLYLWPLCICFSAVFVGANVEVDGGTQLPIMFQPMDVAYFFTIAHLGLYAFSNPKRFVSVLKENPFLSIFIALVALYIIIGVPIWGKRAFGEARKLYFMFLIPWLAAVTIKDPADLRRFLVVIVWAAAGLAIIWILAVLTTGNII